MLDLLGQAIDVDEYVSKLAKGNITVKDDIQVLHIFSGLCFFQTKIHKSTLRQKLVTLTHEAQTLEKLVKITKPVTLPDAKAGTSKESKLFTVIILFLSSSDANKQAFLRKMMKFGNVKKELSNVEANVAAPKNDEKVSFEFYKLFITQVDLLPPTKATKEVKEDREVEISTDTKEIRSEENVSKKKSALLVAEKSKGRYFFVFFIFTFYKITNFSCEQTFYFF